METRVCVLLCPFSCQHRVWSGHGRRSHHRLTTKRERRHSCSYSSGDYAASYSLLFLKLAHRDRNLKSYRLKHCCAATHHRLLSKFEFSCSLLASHIRPASPNRGSSPKDAHIVLPFSTKFVVVFGVASHIRSSSPTLKTKPEVTESQGHNNTCRQ